MTGRGHRLFATAFVAAAAPAVWQRAGVVSVVCLGLFALAGATAPDWLEIRLGQTTVIRHRTLTHVLLLWLAGLAGAGWLLCRQPLGGACLLGFVLGGLSHWVGDVGTPMGVPVWHPMRRVSLGWWRGSTEMVPIALTWAAVIGFLCWRAITH